jgi:4-amino-4-deoxy-L-arabinose transferase-like glycosyltransferase
MDELMAKGDGYDAKTIVMAAIIFAGFAALIYALPAIMNSVGGENRWFAGGIVAAVLVLPFVGLWLRGRVRRKNR